MPAWSPATYYVLLEQVHLFNVSAIHFVDVELSHSSIRFGLGRFTTEEDVDFVIDRVVKHVTKLREMSPLWEMVQEGIDLKSINWSQH